MITYICAMIRFALYFITYQRCKINDEAVHIYADGVGTDKMDILIYCWCKYNLAWLFQNIFRCHMKIALLTQQLKVPLQPQFVTVIENLFCARIWLSVLHML